MTNEGNNCAFEPPIRSSSLEQRIRSTLEQRISMCVPEGVRVFANVNEDPRNP